MKSAIPKDQHWRGLRPPTQRHTSRRWMLLGALLFLPLLWSLSQGCAPEQKGTVGTKCLYNSDCEDNLRCIQGVCGASRNAGDACVNDSECDGNLRCFGGLCAFGERKECTQDSQCGLGNKCFASKSDTNKYCATQNGEGFPCQDDKDCEVQGGQVTLVCSGGYCLKPAEQGKPCPDSKSCLSPLVCSSGGKCIQPGQPGTGGVDDACSNANDCQKGLVCDGNQSKCVDGRSKGQLCELSTGCAKGLVCSAEGKCAAPGEPGTVGSGEACLKLSDCQKGLVCGSQGNCTPRGAQGEGLACTGTEQCLEGLVCAKSSDTPGGACTKAGEPGTKLAGEDCDTSADCSFPFACGFSGKCITVRTYAGTDCSAPKDITGDFRAFFEIPRKDKPVKEFYRLPFPNDIRKKASGFVSLAEHPNPGDLLGADLVTKYLKAIETEMKGFGTHHTVYFRFSKDLDFNSLKLDGAKPALVSYNLTSGGALGRRVSYNGGRGKYICHHYLTVRPFRDTPLLPNQTYAVLLTNVLKSADGDTVKRDADFALMMADTAPTDADLKRAYDAYKPLRDFLKKNADEGKFPGPTDVVSAAVFTTHDPTAQMKRFREVVNARPQPTLKQLTLCDGKNTSPCDGKGITSRACGTPNDDFYEFHAKIELPIFQKGTPPYKETGGDIDYDDEGKPKVARTEEVCVALTIPKGVEPPAEGWPIAIYSHGTGANFRAHVANGTAKKLSSITTPDPAADPGENKTIKVHFATIGIDQNQHGTRRGQDETHPNFLFFNVGNPTAALNNPIQAAADQYTLVQLLQTLKIAQADSPTQKEVGFNKERIVYVGHSQGGVVGPLFLAFAPEIKAAVLSGAGGNLIQSLLNKTKPVDVAATVRAMFGEPKPLGPTHPMLNLLQMYFDRSDGANYGRLLVREPPKDIPAKHILQTYGVDDAFTPPSTMVILAQTLGVQQVGPSEVAISGLTKIDPPAKGNLTSAGKPITATFGQYKPDGYDGHFVIFQNEKAIRHLTQFLATYLTDKDNVPTHVK